MRKTIVKKIHVSFKIENKIPSRESKKEGGRRK
jgi:hypothetical protein